MANIKKVLASLTIDEKIGQLAQLPPFFFIKDLFSSSEIDTLKLLMYILIGISIIAVGVGIFYNPNPEVILANNEVNRAIIDGVVREILGR
jgi:hypothetical protein